jgi:[ribosomal protein S5]-alanine N-acetyltransferase
MPGPVSLTTRRLVVRPFDDTCVSGEYVSWLNDREVVRFSNQRFRSHTADSAREYIASFAGTSNSFLAIRLAESDRMIGSMTVYAADQHGTADMGILIGDRTCWGQGYGLEAWSALMAELFVSRALRKVTGGAVRPNVGMLHIMERSGMHLEAVRSRQEIVDGAEEDVLYFARFIDR